MKPGGGGGGGGLVDGNDPIDVKKIKQYQFVFGDIDRIVKRYAKKKT